MGHELRTMDIAQENLTYKYPTSPKISRREQPVTVCIGAICEKKSAVIMISDAMLTSGGLSIKFEHKTPKLIQVSDNCVAATAGDALAHTELFELAKDELDELKSPSTSDVVNCVKTCYSQLRQKEIVERLLIPRGFPNFEVFYKIQRELVPEIAMTIQGEIDAYSVGGTEGLMILIGGVDSKGAHLHVIGNPGISIPFDSIGYNAIGSGTPHALTTFISKEYYDVLPLNKALLIAYEAKKISEKALGVGEITFINVINSRGVIKFEENDIKELDRVYLEMKKIQEEFAIDKDRMSELDDLLKRLLNRIGGK